MELFAFIAHWAHSVAGLLIVGTSVICLMSLDASTNALNAAGQRLLKSTLILAFILVLSGLFLPPIQAVSISGNSADVFNQELLSLVLFSTRFGSVWAIQEGLSILLLMSLLFHRPLISTFQHKSFFTWLITATSLMLVAGSFKSHAAGLEPIWPGILGHSLHLLAASYWLGALPALWLVFYSSTSQACQPTEATNPITLLKRFSLLASAMVGIILLSGIVIGFLQIDRWAELFSTSYGHYLLVKVFLFLLMISIAGIIRFRYLPKNNAGAPSQIINKAIATWIAIETIIGLVLLGFATVLKNTTPAAHETEIVWPFDFRLSLDATWSETASVQSQVFLGLILITLAAALTLYLFRALQFKKYALIAGGVLTFVGIATALQPLSIPANPDTYRNSTVPYDAITIDNGQRIFSDNCASCHGAEGKGDGVLADDLDVMMMDLNQMHSVGSTAGDMYWSFNQELFKDEYHSPIQPLDEDEVWELINYLSATASSYTARSLYTYIDPNNPFIGAPDFYYSTDSTSGNLKDFRNDKAILLVFFSWPESKGRLNKLKENYKSITANNTDIIAIEIAQDNKAKDNPKPNYPFIVITDQAEPLVNAYMPFRRSIMNKPDFDFASPLLHIEYIVDRFGYLRARWIPENNTSKWTDFPLLNNELAKLANEPEILPPPDEHTH
ncbi:MAG: hypothetical protein A6F70_07685 [Cycloclasticus sp. symbiont of Bathymodiolus heckerae]|nr:MAG: hypothetical protein A6F70_07685 [Cycloclasticus sp. symbiont of Bathymodiolus heckerae]